MFRFILVGPIAFLLACQSDSRSGRASVTRATRFAYSLEDSVIANRAALRTRDALFNNFARGFESDVANRLTDRLWDSTHHEVIGTERAIARPDSIVVLSLARDSAVVTFTTPVVAGWPVDAPYTVAWLRRRGGVWRVAGARDTAIALAPLPLPTPVPDSTP